LAAKTMIVSEDTVSKALQYLSIDPHPIALALKDKTDAENKLEIFFAELYPQTEGSVKERECGIQRNATYRDMKNELAVAEMEVARHKARIKAADMLCEIWRTENANARAAERIR
jgi:hypothetical protein